MLRTDSFKGVLRGVALPKYYRWSPQRPFTAFLSLRLASCSQNARLATEGTMISSRVPRSRALPTFKEIDSCYLKTTFCSCVSLSGAAVWNGRESSSIQVRWRAPLLWIRTKFETEAVLPVQKVADQTLRQALYAYRSAFHSAFDASYASIAYIRRPWEKNCCAPSNPIWILYIQQPPCYYQYMTNRSRRQSEAHS